MRRYMHECIVAKQQATQDRTFKKAYTRAPGAMSCNEEHPQPCLMDIPMQMVGPSSVPAFCDSSVPAGIRSFLPAWWAQMSQIDGGPLCSKLHKCSTHKYCVGTDDLRCFGALQLLDNFLRNCHRCLLWVTCGTVRHLRVLYLCLLSVPCSSHVW